MDVLMKSTKADAMSTTYKTATRGCRGRSLALLLLGLGGFGQADAQSSRWDAALSNSNWYVPTPQLLAYASPRTGFIQPLPIGDQTLWALGRSVNGSFGGLSTANLAIGGTTTVSQTVMQGTVTPAGQITILFTPTTGGTPTLGIGQMRTRGDVPEMEMQMITGTSLLITHWAYMAPYNPATFNPPAAQAIPLDISARNWNWTEGTPWRIVSPALFGTAGTGKFIITDYKNGYFWGQGIGPTGGTVTSFTLLGSTTPEGKVLFNTLSNEKLTSLYGDITGNALNAQMILGTYGPSGPSEAVSATLDLVRPYTETIAATNNPSAMGAATVLYGIAGTTNGLYGTMSPVIDTLNNMSGPALSNAISQTLPVLVGGASQATYNTQRAFQQTIMARLDNIRGMESGDYFATERDVWIKPFGSVTNQSGLNNVPGYRASGGGIAVGVDKSLSDNASLGGVFAYSYNILNGSSDATASTLGINSYQLGIYGAYALAPDTDLSVQIDGGANQNRENRSVVFMNTGAQANYASYTAHVGAGIRKIIPMTPQLSLIPLLRVDYAAINADAYQESGAAYGLNLNVNAQLYQELMLTAGLKGNFQATDKIRLTANAGVGYNALNNQTQITASYSGGGESFVTRGLNVSPWLVSAGLGVVALQKNDVELSARYDVQASPTGYLNQMASIHLSMKY